jgi:ABC-type amino acid transport system permease subunit
MPDNDERLATLSNQMHRFYRRHGGTLLGLSITLIACSLTLTVVQRGFGAAVNNIVVTVGIVFGVPLVVLVLLIVFFPHLLVQMPGDTSPRFLMVTMIILAVLAVAIPLTASLLR